MTSGEPTTFVKAESLRQIRIDTNEGHRDMQNVYRKQQRLLHVYTLTILRYRPAIFLSQTQSETQAIVLHP